MEPPSWPARLSRLRQLFWLFFVLIVVYMICVQRYLSPLSSGDFVQFEIAKTVNKANAIIQDWKNTGKYEQGLKTTYFVFVFIILYTIVIALGCRYISTCTGNEIMIRGGKGFAWLIGVAAICDIIENIAMARTLHGAVSPLNVIIAYDMARVKFSIVIVCILFMLACFMYWAIGRLGKLKG